MEQILFYELPRYLSLEDQNTLCSLNKEFYGKLRGITPSYEDIVKKWQVHVELMNVTDFIAKNMDKFMLDPGPYSWKIMRFRERETSWYPNSERATYHGCKDRRLTLIYRGKSKGKYIWDLGCELE